MLQTILAFLVATGTVLTVVEVVLVAIHFSRTRRKRVSRADHRPMVSILKPMCGHDDGLYENLASFASLKGVAYEVILSVADPHDPSMSIARQVIRDFPFAPFTIVAGTSSHVRAANPKIERLIDAARLARGEILMISDSNVRLTPDALERTIELFEDPRVGCVVNPFAGDGARDLGAKLEGLHLLTFVLTGSVVADRAGVPCVVGKSMSLRRNAWEAIGRFEAFANVLAEDQAIGLALAREGFDIALAPVVVKNVIERRTIRRAAARQIRWNKIRYSFSTPTYISEFLLNPLPFAIVLAAISSHHAVASAIALGVAALRVLAAALLGSFCGAALDGCALLQPFQDLVQFGCQFVPFFSRSVEWRGHRARLGRNTEIVEIRKAA